MKKGKFIVIMGVDGSGKSSITNAIKNKYENIGRKVTIEHWRPNVLPNLKKNKEIYTEKNINEINKNSNSISIMSKIKSDIRYVYYILDFIVGYYTKIKPKVNKGEFFIVERYYFDNLINPSRYKFYNESIGKIVYPLIKKPDCLILVKCDPNISYERKKELTVEKLKIDQDKYIEFVNNYELEKLVIDTSFITIEEAMENIKYRLER